MRPRFHKEGGAELFRVITDGEITKMCLLLQQKPNYQL